MIHFSQLKLITTRTSSAGEVAKAAEVSADVTADVTADRSADRSPELTDGKMKKKTSSLLLSLLGKCPSGSQ